MRLAALALVALAALTACGQAEDDISDLTRAMWCDGHNISVEDC